jgi:cytochrome c peroxidase
MEDKKLAEEANGDARYAAAYDELNAEMVRLTAEMDAAITAAIASFEETLAGAKADMNAAIQTATDALYAFIEGRLADWGTKATDEERNALWQEDSYYRFSLL